MRIRRVTAGLVAVALGIAACSGGNGDRGRHADGDLPGDAGAIDVERVGHLTDDEVGDIAGSVTAFGFDLHRALAAEGGNVVTSPLSVALLLAMVAAGAGEATADEMAEVLHVEEVRDNRFGALLRQVADTDDVTLSVANALWADDQAAFEDDYVGHVHRVLGATLETADLGAQETADAIDTWVRDRSEDLIDGIAEDLGLPDPAAVLVLLNAAYFLGEWTHQFDPAETEDRDFHLADGTTVQVPTMYRPAEQEAEVELAVRDGYQVLRLPYGQERRYAMEVFLPEPDRDLTWLLQGLDAAEWQAAVDALQTGTADSSSPGSS